MHVLLILEYYKNKKLVAVSNPQEGTVGVVYSTARGGWCRLRVRMLSGSFVI